jgi:hypothetical protein
MVLKRNTPTPTAEWRSNRGMTPNPPVPDTAGTPTEALDLAAIAALLAPHLDKQAKAGRKVPAPPKDAAVRPNPRGGQHQAPGLGWSTAWVAIVALIVIGIVVLGLAWLHVL